MTIYQQDIARQAGVSKTAVSMALRHDPRISPALRDRIHRLAKDLGYRPNLLARAMRHQKTRTVGLIMPNFRTGVTNFKVEVLEEILAGAGYQMVIGFTQADGDRLMTQVQSLLDRQVDGLIIVGDHLGPQRGTEAMELVRQHNKACLFFDSAAPAQSVALGIDRLEAVRLVFDHLVQLGHRDILYLRGNISDAPHTKWHGVQAWARNRREPAVRVNWMFLHRPEVMDISQDVANEMCERRTEVQSIRLGFRRAMEIARWPHRPTAVVASSDAIAEGVIKGLARTGVQVPGDVSVAGLAQSNLCLQLDGPTITVARYPLEQLAREVAEQILRLMDGEAVAPEQRLLAPMLDVGDSTLPAGHRE